MKTVQVNGVCVAGVCVWRVDKGKNESHPSGYQNIRNHDATVCLHAFLSQFCIE